MSDTTYIFENVEVQLTGRVAEKTGRTRTYALVEITPVDKDGPTWFKWVEKNQLFTVKNKT